MRRRLGRLLALLALGLLVAPGPMGCAGSSTSPEEPSAEPSPVLWRARSPEAATFYLLGSVHMGGQTAHYFGHDVARAWRGADELVVEIDLSEIRTEEMVSLTRLYGTLQPPLSLQDLVSGETWGQLDAYFTMRGLDVAAFQHLKPWFVSFTVVQIELQRAGFVAENGVDRAFIDAAQGDKPIVALETLASQLATMDRLPASLQELMLRDALARIDSFPQDTAELLDAWQQGDEVRLESLVFKPLQEYPELGVFYDLVFYRRNHTMTGRLLQLAEDGRTRFVVLGAGHMLGDQGIPRLLEKQGYEVSRVR